VFAKTRAVTKKRKMSCFLDVVKTLKTLKNVRVQFQKPLNHPGR